MLTIKNRLRRLFDFLIYGNVFIAFCAAISTLSTAKLLNAAHLIAHNAVRLAYFVGAATFFLYNLHKPVTSFLQQQFMANQRFTRAKTFERPLSILSILAVIFCFYAFFQLKTTAQILLIGMAILSLGYVLPILGRGRRLRDVGFLKIFLIAVVWAAITVVLPFLALENTLNTTDLWLLFTERTCFIAALCLPFDIRDMDWDSTTQVKTIPLSIGIKKTKILSIIALITAFSMDYLLLNKLIYEHMLCLKLIIVYLLTALIILKTEKNGADYFFYVLVDGMILIHSLMLLTVYNNTLFGF